MDFVATDKLMIRYFPFIRCWRQNGSIKRDYIIYL